MARSVSGLTYAERFFAAATYAGFSGSFNPAAKFVISKSSNDTTLLLYGLYQQAAIGPCNIHKPRGPSPVEHSKWTRCLQCDAMYSRGYATSRFWIVGINSNNLRLLKSHCMILSRRRASE